MQINENEIYTTLDVQKILKISQSTTMRLLKKGLIRAAKIGKQYRITGKELLRFVSLRFDDELDKLNKGGKQLVQEEVSGKSGGQV